MASLDDTYVMVCAIDFGTTFSGYAFSFRTKENDITMNKNWGEGLGCQSYKTPTSVLTGPDGHFVAFGHEAENKFGELIEEDEGEGHGYDLFRHFKMVLHKNQKLSRRTAIASVSGTIRPAIDIVTMSLKFLKEHLLEELNKQFQSKADPSFIRWVITVPAIWQEEAKQFMREAAFRAGCINKMDSNKLLIALEPEAASIYCRSIDVKQFLNMDSEGSGCFSFPTGTRYLVVDAGGGTVDVTAHQVLPGSKMKELHVANGGALGGTKVDAEFTNLLKKVLGADFMEMFCRDFPQQWFTLMSTFEKVKKSFKPDGKCKINISLGYALGSKFQEVKRESIEKKIKESSGLGVSFRNGCLILNHDVAASLYDKVIQSIVHHIRSLLSLPELQDITYLLLVGGFGECTYLQEKLKQSLPRNVSMLVPNEAQLAVIKGAVLFGHRPTAIESRISIRTFGLSVMKKFKNGVHEEERKEVINGVAWCRNVFQVIIKKGDIVDAGKTWEERRIPHKPDQKNMNIRIYALDRIPSDMEYVDHPDMVQIGRLNIEMTNTEKGLDRAVIVYVHLGGTEILVSATDVDSGNTIDASIDMLQD